MGRGAGCVAIRNIRIASFLSDSRRSERRGHGMRWHHGYLCRCLGLVVAQTLVCDRRRRALDPRKAYAWNTFIKRSWMSLKRASQTEVRATLRHAGIFYRELQSEAPAPAEQAVP